MKWQENAITILRESLYPIPTEKNEIDWKTDISPKTERLAQHLCAFSNQQGGGLLVYGVNDNGRHFSLDKPTIDNIIQKLSSIAQNNLTRSIIIEHDVLEFEGHNLLFVYIPEQADKPIGVKGKEPFNCYGRTAGTTIKLSKQQIIAMMARTQGISFEMQVAKEHLTSDEVLRLLNYKKFYELSDKRLPTTSDLILNTLKENDLCKFENNSWSITNVGALLFANNIHEFSTLQSKTVIVRKYTGANNLNLESEQIGQFGYAVGFEGLIKYIIGLIPQTEIINAGIRQNVPIYPAVAIREFVANALVHQDFAISGVKISIEIFSNRLTITNAGAPLNDVNRLIDLPPHSRNEIMAQKLYTLGICERRGSGIDRAITAIEERCLPPVKITKNETHTRIFLYPPKKFGEMDNEERIRACYQHACILNESGGALTNQSFRERMGVSKKNSAMISRVISAAVSAGYIKAQDPENTSKKFNSYIPYYA